MTVVPLPLEQNQPGDTLVHGADGGSVVRRSVLPGGVRVLTEAMPGQRSATIGFWVGVGSRDEAPGQHGSTHFLEHLLFKGTKRRTALEIASAFDEVGGESNAATAKESTCYFARVLDTDLPMAIDVIADMITGAVLDPAEMEQERDVILEEIAMDSDDPTDVAHEHFVAAVLGTPPAGPPHRRHPRRHPGRGPRLRLGALPPVLPPGRAGHHRRRRAGARRRLRPCGGCAPRPPAGHLSPTPPPWNGAPPSVPHITGTAGLHVVKRAVEQANIIMGCPTIVATDDRRYVMSVLNAVLGGGMSSRLFQEIREKRGLVYSTYSFASSYADAGYFGMYAGCTPSKVRQVLDLLGAELDKLAEDGISDDELRKAVGQLCGGIVLALEDTGSRMSRLGRAELVSGEYQDIDETLRLIKAVTARAGPGAREGAGGSAPDGHGGGPVRGNRNVRALSRTFRRCPKLDIPP